MEKRTTKTDPDRDRLRDTINANLEAVLEHYGLPTDGRHFPCTNPEHTDETPSAHFYKANGGKFVKCFSCPGNGVYDAIAVIQHREGAGYLEALRIGAGILGENCAFLPSPAGGISQTPPKKPVLSPVERVTGVGGYNDTPEGKLAILGRFLPPVRAIYEKGAGEAYLARRVISKTTAEKMGVFELPGDKNGRGFQYVKWLEREQANPDQPKKPGFPALLFPLLSLAGEVKGYVARFTTTRNPTPSKPSKVAYIAGTGTDGVSGFFGAEALTQPTAPVFVTEGEIDALTFREIGYLSVSMGSTSKVARFAKALTDWAENHTLPPLILALDTDDAGYKAQAQLSQALKGAGIRFTSLPPECWDGLKFGTKPVKDSNDAIMADRNRLENVARTAFDAVIALSEGESMEDTVERENSPFEGASTALEVLGGLFAEPAKQPTATGYPNLDGWKQGEKGGLLRGGLRGGLAVLIGEPATGKTAFALSIADNVAMTGKKVLIFSLEMTKKELVCRSLARESYQTVELNRDGQTVTLSTPKDRKSRALDTLYFYEEYTAGKEAPDHREREAERAVFSYKRYAENITIVSGLFSVTVDELETRLEDFYNLHGEYPALVVLDYLQILAVPEGGNTKTDKQAVDYNVKQLRKLAGEKGIPFLVLSSVNRDSYGSGLSLSSAKESGAVEYCADVVLSLEEATVQAKTKEEKKALEDAKEKTEPDTEREARVYSRLIRCHTLKYRQGKKGKVYFDYKPAYNSFRAVRNEQAEAVLGKIKEGLTGNVSTGKTRYSGEPEYEAMLLGVEQAPDAEEKAPRAPQKKRG